jgi:hypothetical protein
MGSLADHRLLVVVAMVVLFVVAIATAQHIRLDTQQQQQQQAPPQPTSPRCLGEFELCAPINKTDVGGSCVMFAEDCGRCSRGEYLCPDHQTCVPNAEAYKACPAIKVRFALFTAWSHLTNAQYLLSIA